MLDSAHALKTRRPVVAGNSFRRFPNCAISKPIPLLSLLDSASSFVAGLPLAARISSEGLPPGLCKRNHLVWGLLLLGIPRNEFLWQPLTPGCLWGSNPFLSLPGALSRGFWLTDRPSGTFATSRSHARPAICSVYMGGR